MPLRAALASLILYLGAVAGANPAAAQDIGPSDRAALEALRQGDMRKLTVHDAPLPATDTSFTTEDGAEVRLADSNGQVRLVNFWATWCAPCRVEKPALDALNRDKGGPDFAVIAVATGRNTPEAIDDFNTEVGIETLEVFLDPQSALAAAMQVPGLPITVVLDREGGEIARLLGSADWNGPSARAIVDYLVALPH